MSAHKRDHAINRRDFINGMLIAAGTAGVGGSIPMRAFAQLGSPTTFPCDGPIGTDPNVMRGGNQRSVFNIAHWLRDGRLTFKTNSVSISPSPCDSFTGSQPILADNGNYDVIIVGSGMSGCSAAFYITQQRPGTKILILDGQRTPGGNANRDDAPPIPDIASTATAYAVQPYADFLNNIYNTTGILWQNYVVAFPPISSTPPEFFPEFAYPGGTPGMLRHVVKWLIPSSIAGPSDAALLANPFNLTAMDSVNNNVRIRQGALVLRGDTANNSASVVYFLNGQFFRATAKAVIFAGQSHTARTACAHLLSSSQAAAFDQLTLSPVVTANVTIRTAAPVVDLGYDAYYWGSQYWADFVVADWVGSNRNNPNRETVLTFYGGNTASVDDQPNERIKLLTTPFSSYEDSLRADMSRVLAGRNFDFDRDVTAVYLNRWGHSMIYPKPGWPFSAPIIGNGGNVTRVPSARFYSRQQIARISFGSQDVQSRPPNYSAICASMRTSGEVLPLL